MFGNIRRLHHGLRTAIAEPGKRGALSLAATPILIATVGYGDLAPKTAVGKIFTIGYIFAGIGVFVATAAALARAVMRSETEPPK